MACTDKYLLTVTGRVDGSSKFGESNKYAFFPSAAIAWRISEEPFLEGSNVISNLKLRGSYGLTGNSEINAYSSLPALRVITGVINNARALGVGAKQEPANNQSRLGNPDHNGKRQLRSDIGIELGLWNNRISIEADVYYRKTTDMLLSAPLPHTSGYETITRNVGSMENKGIGVALNTENISLMTSCGLHL